MKPLILINFKTYKESSGKKAIILAKKIEKVKSARFQIAVAPSLLTAKEIAEQTKLMVFAQHADAVEYGAHTGSIPPQELKEIGVKKILLNHSERKLTFPQLRQTVELCKLQGLIVVVCASTLNEIKKIAALHPDYIAYEPSELIGGNVSVTKADASIIKRAVSLVKQLSPKTNVLCGAGVHSRKDLQQAFALGTSGVLLAHAVVKARNPKEFLEEMIS